MTDAALATEDLAFLTPEERREIALLAQDNVLWKPLPGPQTRALLSDADEIFFGGQAGGGKTDGLLGISITQHYNSIIFRREYPQLRGIVDRGNAIIGDRGSYNSQEHVWRLKDGRVLELGAVQYLEDVSKYQGRPHDFIGFDELPNFLEFQFRFLIGWNRSTRPGQRCRVFATGNPPTNAEGEWVIHYWGPWLDKNHPNPAVPGEIRWFAVIEGKDIERPDGTPFPSGKILANGVPEMIIPRSRTFIPASLNENPFLANTGYSAVLQGMPEPLRSQMLYGDFTLTQTDNPWQVIPTEWVRAAMKRWTPDRPVIENLQRIPATPTTRHRDIVVGKPLPLSAVGADIARGGKDNSVFARRYGTWYDKLDIYTGKETYDAPRVVALLLPMLKEGGVCNIDGIGIGAAVVDLMRNYIDHRANSIIFSQGSVERDKTNSFGFLNMRAQAYWQFREQLDPQAEEQIALPPDEELLSDLCAPTYSMQVSGVKIESKEDIRKRIGRSPDKGDAVVLASMLGKRPMHHYNYSLY
jgi:hypothetical protein